jgi:SAM-dependent methyltransferase
MGAERRSEPPLRVGAATVDLHVSKAGFDLYGKLVPFPLAAKTGGYPYLSQGPMKLDPQLLRCPDCKNGGLTASADQLTCPTCHHAVPLVNGVPIFDQLKSSDVTDGMDSIKHFFKQYPTLYKYIVIVLSPVYYAFGVEKKFLRNHVNGRQVVAINLGSGNSRLAPNLVNVDIFAYPNVDLVCNLETVPIQDGSADVIMNIAVLEHLPDPQAAVREMFRLLKRGGHLYSFVPFIQGFHASPHDFQRYTREGLKRLYQDFDLIEVRNGEGPVSGFLWVFQEMVAIALSFGNVRLHRYLLIAMMLLTFPIKYLDALFMNHPCAHNITGGFIFIGRKP